MHGQKLKVVDKFIYLGSTLDRAVHIGVEVTARIAEASVAFRSPRSNVWERNGIKPTHLYACETWTIYQRHAKRLNHLFEKAVETQVARHDSRHGGPEESRDVNHAGCLKASTAKVDWPCYKNA